MPPWQEQSEEAEEYDMTIKSTRRGPTQKMTKVKAPVPNLATQDQSSSSRTRVVNKNDKLGPNAIPANVETPIPDEYFNVYNTEDGTGPRSTNVSNLFPSI
jgi:hypothetical protein